MLAIIMLFTRVSVGERPSGIHDGGNQQATTTTTYIAQWWNVSGTDIADLRHCNGNAACTTFEAQALVYSLQGLANRDAPRLFFDNGRLNVDFPQSDAVWKEYLERERGVEFATPGLAPDLCVLVTAYGGGSGAFQGAVRYVSDGVSVFVAMTMSGARRALPVSARLAEAFPCLGELPVMVEVPPFSTKYDAYEWALNHINSSMGIVYNANFYPGSTNGDLTLMSADYPVARGAFIMNLRPCWSMVDTPPCNASETRETELFMRILRTRNNLVSVWGWSDPEHAYTNATTVANGTVFCTFSTSNLAFWAALGTVRRTVGLPAPQREPAKAYDPNAVYISFETNEGDTPRILTSQFTSQWLSPHRGSVPVAWAVDPYLGELFPELWNFYMTSATENDTFLAGVDGAGYVYVHTLGSNERAYEKRATRLMSRYGLSVVDVGVANARYAAVTITEIERYLNNSVIAATHEANSQDSAQFSHRTKTAKTAISAFVNACGASWGQHVNNWLADGTPVINSVCKGPSNPTNYLYYYRGNLNASDPERDLAQRILWATGQYAVPGRPLFLNIFGGLDVYGGHGDFFVFLQSVMKILGTKSTVASIPRKFVVVGAPELARLARLAAI